jgi:hypothetical protein
MVRAKPRLWPLTGGENNPAAAPLGPLRHICSLYVPASTSQATWGSLAGQGSSYPILSCFLSFVTPRSRRVEEFLVTCPVSKLWVLLTAPESSKGPDRSDVLEGSMA